jgi:hypothetical protein
MTPTKVIEVSGACVCISVVVSCSAVIKSNLLFVLGLLYVPIVVYRVCFCFILVYLYDYACGVADCGI